MTDLPPPHSAPSERAILAAVLLYARLGWPVIPLEPREKRPLSRLVPHGVTHATTDANTLRFWWGAEPNANIGIACAGLAVIDVDPRNGGEEELRAIQPERLPRTPAAKTGSGGWHKWVEAAGIKRRIRWHDLRHTCATSLLAGWWGGRKWTLDEVCGYLGHSSVKVTERYARKLGETQAKAVSETKFPVGQAGGGNVAKPLNATTPCKTVIRGFESRPHLRSKDAASVDQAPGGWELDGNTRRIVRLLKLADIDPRAARPGLAVCRAYERVAFQDLKGARRVLRKEAHRAG